MSRTRPSALTEVLRELLVRSGLGSGVEDLTALNRAWLRAAGPEWRGSWVIGLRDGELQVAVASPAAATRLRFESARIRKALRDQGWREIQAVRAKVRPEAGEVARADRGRQYSERAASAVQEGAGEVSDPELRSALQRLGRRLSRRPGGTGENGPG